MIQEKLRETRKAKGMSQEKMAKLLCTDTSNYSRKERGEVRIQEKEWEKIAKALEVSVEDLKDATDKFSIKNDNPTFSDNSGNYNQYYSFSKSVIKNLQDFIKHLQIENEQLKKKLKKYEE